MRARSGTVMAVVLGGVALLVTACGSTATSTTPTTVGTVATSTTTAETTTTAKTTTSTAAPGTTEPPPVSADPFAWTPDETHGVIRGTLTEQVQCVAAPCPPQPISGTITIRSEGPLDNLTVETGSDGRFGGAFEPGTYLLRATSPRAVTCPNTPVQVEAGQVAEANIVCDLG